MTSRSDSTNLRGFHFVYCGLSNKFLGLCYALLAVLGQGICSRCSLECFYPVKISGLPVIARNCSGCGIFAFNRGCKQYSIQVNFSTCHSDSSCDHLNSQGASYCDDERGSLQIPTQRLEILDLSRNHLSVFPDILPKTLKQLYFSNNRIVELEARRILFLENLEILFVDGNLITLVGNRTCTGGHFWQNMHASNLQKLSLQRNRIEEIQPNAFLHLTRLTGLSLAGNRLKSLHQESFAGLDSLVDLDLSENILFRVADYTFKSLVALTFLSLRGNQLLLLPKGLPMLEWLDVSHNFLQTVAEDFKQEVHAIEFTNFAHNPLLCDCKILWLKEVYDRREHMIEYMDLDPRDVIPSCASPANLINESWDVLSDDMFVCEHELKVVPQSKEQPPDLHIKGQVLNESSVAVVWKFKKLPVTTARILIYYYVFGLKSSTLKHVKSLATDTQYVLGNLSPQTNYMICISLAKKQSITEQKLEASPILLDQCIEVTTKMSQPVVATTYFAIYWWYVLTMVTTFVTVIGCITGLALLCSLWNRRNALSANSTYPVDEPLLNPCFPVVEEVNGNFKSKLHCSSPDY